MQYGQWYCNEYKRTSTNVAERYLVNRNGEAVPFVFLALAITVGNMKRADKALVRHLRNQYLPKGVVFTISGRYVGEEYIAMVS